MWETQQHQRIQIKSSDPELAAALESGDDNKIEKVVGERIKVQIDAKRNAQEKRIKLMNADPNDLEAQKEIEELIKKDMINDNHSMAQEMYPEFFGQVSMLYVDVKVNKCPIQAFVDSGA